MRAGLEWGAINQGSVGFGTTRGAQVADDRLVTKVRDLPRPHALRLEVRTTPARQKQGSSIRSLATEAALDRKTIMRVQRGSPRTACLYAPRHSPSVRPPTRRLERRTPERRTPSWAAESWRAKPSGLGARPGDANTESSPYLTVARGEEQRQRATTHSRSMANAQSRQFRGCRATVASESSL